MTVVTLTSKEKAVALITNGIAVYVMLQERNEQPPNITMFDFVMRIVPEDLKSKITIELIDEVFQYVSTSHGS